MSRLVPIALVLFLWAAAAGAAPTAFAPRLVVSSGGGTVRIGLLDADGAATVAIQVPAANGIAAPAPGTVLGPATAVDAAGGLAGAVVAAAPSAVPVCGVAPVQTWTLQLTGGGRTVDVPVYVTGARTLVLCLAATPLRSLTFSTTAIAVAPGPHRWASDWVSGGATVEAQSVDPGPLRLTTAIRRRRVWASGRVATYVRVASRVVPGTAAAIATRVNGTRVGGAHGSFLLAGTRRANVSVQAVVNGGSSDGGLVFRGLGAAGCAPAAVPCTSATLGGADLTTRAVVRAYAR